MKRLYLFLVLCLVFLCRNEMAISDDMDDYHVSKPQFYSYEDLQNDRRMENERYEMERYKRDMEFQKQQDLLMYKNERLRMEAEIEQLRNDTYRRGHYMDY